jgi:hypothetical protein
LASDGLKDIRRRGLAGGLEDAGVPELGVDFGPGASYRIVECSRLRRSKARKLPSAPTEQNISVEPGSQATSNTSRSCAISCVIALRVLTSQTVHVVSMEEVTIRAGEMAFQEKEVSGAGETVGGDLDCVRAINMPQKGEKSHVNVVNPWIEKVN